MEPDRPVPDTFIVRVFKLLPSDTPEIVPLTHEGAAAPFERNTCPEVPAANWAVVPAADWYGTVPAEPPAKLVAVVALVALVALVAVEALPFKAAVIVPALKLPEASRATIVEAVFKFVALVASVTAVEPL